MKTSHHVAVIGASDDPERYAYKAIQQLLDHGYRVSPITPRPVTLPGLTVYPTLAEVPEPIDTVTLYVNSRRVGEMLEELLQAKPGRVIFNPGTENAEVARRLREAGIATEEACTLVLLGTNQF